MMKYLKEYIKEGLFDDLDKIEKIGGMESNAKQLKKDIIDWICNNYVADLYPKKKIAKSKLKVIFGDNGVVVNYDGEHVRVSNHNIEHLTNGLFKWGPISGNFNCQNCTLLKTLEGAPEKVDGGFYCANCTSLETLEGAPKEVGNHFNCQACNSLKNLEGAPEKVGWDFYCQGSKSLTSLKGAPKEVDRDFYCFNCGTKFTEDDVKKVSKVKKRIICKQ